MSKFMRAVLLAWGAVAAILLSSELTAPTATDTAVSQAADVPTTPPSNSTSGAGIWP